MLKAVLFDLDGVLVDSEEYSSKTADMVYGSYGMKQTPQEKANVFGRKSIDNYRAAIKARGLDIDPYILVEKHVELFKKLIRGKLKPLPGAVKLIDCLKEAKVKVAVVSSSPRERVKATLAEVKLLDRFDIIISGDDCEKGKPDPQPYLLAAERLKVRPEDCVVIEDAQAGVESGKAANMKVIAVRSPNTHGQDLSKADKTVDSLEDVTVSMLRTN